MESAFSDKVKFVAQMVEKFVEHNLVEKEQRDENFRKLAGAFEAFLKDNPIRQSFRGGNVTEAAKANQETQVEIKKLAHFKGELPKYQSKGASGFDVRAQLEQEIVLKPGQRVLVPTGLAFAIPNGFEIQARPRSGSAIRDGLSLVNTPGTIDADYRGEVKIILINLGEADIVIKDQDRIAQFVLAPVVVAKFNLVDELDETVRGAGGFGSTGKV